MKVVSQGNSFDRDTRFAEELVSKGNSFRREARFVGKLVSEESRFAGNSTKTFVFILVVKYIACNTKFGEIISFCDFFQKNYAGSSN